MVDTFEEMANEIEQNENNSGLTEGDDCPEDCSNELHRRDHPRDSQLGTERHPEAPETEIVCRHHGVMEKF